MDKSLHEMITRGSYNDNCKTPMNARIHGWNVKYKW